MNEYKFDAFYKKKKVKTLECNTNYVNFLELECKLKTIISF